jgi:hypothetical protein
MSLCYENISSAERDKQTARGRSTQHTNNSDPITSTSELLLKQNSVTAHATNLRLADLSLTTAQQRSTGQNLPSDLYLKFLAGLLCGLMSESRKTFRILSALYETIEATFGIRKYA